jgi:hypothetical protein
MSETRTPTYQNVAADRDLWQLDDGTHYRELAHWLRDVARRCRLPNPQRELLALAERYERRANCMDSSAVFVRAELDDGGAAGLTGP